MGMGDQSKVMDMKEMQMKDSPGTSPGASAHADITRDRPVFVQIEDDLVRGGPRSRMNITVWVDAFETEEQGAARARALTIGFLERALESIRAASKGSPAADPAGRAQVIGRYAGST